MDCYCFTKPLTAEQVKKMDLLIRTFILYCNAIVELNDTLVSFVSQSLSRPDRALGMRYRWSKTFSAKGWYKRKTRVAVLFSPRRAFVLLWLMGILHASIHTGEVSAVSVMSWTACSVPTRSERRSRPAYTSTEKDFSKPAGGGSAPVTQESR